MSELEDFRELIRETLTLTALEIFGKFEKKLTEYQAEISRSKQESDKLQLLLDIVKKPALKLLHQTDVQHPSLLKPPQIKEEQELWTNQEEEQASKLEFSNMKMSKLYMMREFVSERLTTTASEIFGAFELTFSEYQEEICRSEEERKWLERRLNIFTQPKIKIHRIDVQHLSLLEPPQIKEEQELWTNQEEEHLQGLQAETTDSIFTPLSVEHDSDQEGFSECSHQDQTVHVDNREEDSLPSNTAEEQIKAEPHVQDYAAPEPVSDSQPLSVVAPDCPAAQRLEEHGGEIPLLLETVKLSRETKNMALPVKALPPGSHTTDKPYKCPECNKSYDWNSKLLIHMRTHTREKPYQCQECKKTFRWQPGLRSHMRTHTGEKPFQCQECKKTFRWQPGLICHMRTHTGEKPFQCQECKKTFRWQSSLVCHMRIHTGEKPFSCAECTYAFRTRAGLRMHMRKHTGEKPFQCQECQESFSNNRNLKDHIMIHKGEKPFSCAECTYTFRTKAGLMKHMRKHTGEKPHHCKICNLSFLWYNGWRKHMNTHGSLMSLRQAQAGFGPLGLDKTR